MSLNITGLKVQSSNVVVEKCTRRGFSLLLLEKWTLKRISCIGFSGFPCEEQCLIGRGCLFSPSPPSFHSWSQLSTYCDFFRPFPVVSGSMWVLNAAQKGSHLGFVGHDEGITASLYTSLSHTSFIPPAKVFFFFLFQLICNPSRNYFSKFCLVVLFATLQVADMGWVEGEYHFLELVSNQSSTSLCFS